MNDFYRDKAREDQLKKQVDEIYEMLESSQAWMPKIAKELEKKIILKEIKNSSYEEVLASKLKIIEKANEWESYPTRILRIIVALTLMSLLWLAFDLDKVEKVLEFFFG
tara:strand:+ start:197 stop:523 length:327 start_codon:yes stop_codon:yes gene_type:complete